MGRGTAKRWRGCGRLTDPGRLKNPSVTALKKGRATSPFAKPANGEETCGQALSDCCSMRGVTTVTSGWDRRARMSSAEE